jgi:hypothetical protein
MLGMLTEENLICLMITELQRWIAVQITDISATLEERVKNAERI